MIASHCSQTFDMGSLEDRLPDFRAVMIAHTLFSKSDMLEMGFSEKTIDFIRFTYGPPLHYGCRSWFEPVETKEGDK